MAENDLIDQELLASFDPPDEPREDAEDAEEDAAAQAGGITPDDDTEDTENVEDLADQQALHDAGCLLLSGEQAYQALRDAGCLLPVGETNAWAVTTEVVVNRRSARIRDQQPRSGV